MAASASGAGVIIVAHMKRSGAVYTLFGQIFREELVAPAAAMVAGRVEEVPCQSRAARAQQTAELA